MPLDFHRELGQHSGVRSCEADTIYNAGDVRNVVSQSRLAPGSAAAILSRIGVLVDTLTSCPGSLLFPSPFTASSPGAHAKAARVGGRLRDRLP